MSDDTKITMVLGLIITLIFLGIMALGPLIERAKCNRISSDSNIKTSYRLLGGCYVEVNGRMIPKENWRGEYEQ